ncbi:MAG: hypothetical protein PF588_00705 [Candidatus Kapabacteria bacterium]|jgi:hypothetical protein|nr:hypothetical protein [Candidatus Kapabacteria bacterium]
MRKYIALVLIGMAILLGSNDAKAQSGFVDRQAMIDSMTTIDPEVMRYFPRWRICESDLQIQIHKSFKTLGYPEENLDMTRIIVLSMPHQYVEDPYEILSVECGSESMNATELEDNLGLLLDFISGDVPFATNVYSFDLPKRDYCYTDLEPDIPVTIPQQEAIVNFMEPTNVEHSISLSLFEQTLKIGDTGFWFKAKIGNDPIGYHFWSAGEAQVLLKKPLYFNKDAATSERIPYLLDIHLGYSYRITSGVNGTNTALNWVGERALNTVPGGKVVFGTDFHLPVYPEVGLHINMELPLETFLEPYAIDDEGNYAIDRNKSIEFKDNMFKDDRALNEEIDILGTAPVLKATGQVTAFYNWWMNNKSSENYVRVDLGISYSEVQELAVYKENYNDNGAKTSKTFFDNKEINGLRTWKPSELGDWVYLKAEYRNSASNPFGFSLQYSNQIFLGRVYVPIFGEWLYLEAKYATPLRAARSYEATNFFMISPVLRLSI